MRKYLEVSLSIIGYGYFGLTWVAFIAFIGGWAPAWSVDSGPVVPLGQTLATDVVCLTLFFFHHSLLARAPVKALVVRLVPPALERTSYVLVSSLALGAVMVLWRPLPTVLWETSGPARIVVLVLFWCGVTLSLVSSHLLDGLQLFGVRQTLAPLLKQAGAAAAFRTPGPYRLVRHPMMTGILVTLWAAPTMTLGRLLLAVLMTVYILVAVHWLEEADLRRTLGAEYVRYQARVPMLFPRPMPARDDGEASPRETDGA